MSYCKSCDVKLLGSGYMGSGKCGRCYPVITEDESWVPPALADAEVVMSAKVLPTPVETPLTAKRPEIGTTCPTCKQKVKRLPMSAAERKRKWRASQK